MDLEEAVSIISKCVEATSASIADARMIIKAWDKIQKELKN